jgi:D-alanine-D-alanine ligase
MRLTPEGNLYVLEANANPNLAQTEDFATSALAASVGYDKVLERIIQLGLTYGVAWRAS